MTSLARLVRHHNNAVSLIKSSMADLSCKNSGLDITLKSLWGAFSLINDVRFLFVSTGIGTKTYFKSV